MTDNCWNRVLDLLDRKEISRKEFAMKVGISYSSIHNGAIQNSIPSADVALLIAYELNTSLEYLVYGTQGGMESKNQERFIYEKNRQLLTALENLEPQVRQSVEDLIFTLEKSSSSTPMQT